jgi:hypothetical protein
VGLQIPRRPRQQAALKPVAYRGGSFVGFKPPPSEIPKFWQSWAETILKYQKITKILLYEMKFLVPNYSCLQNPWLGGYRPQIHVLSVLCPQLNLLNPLPPNKIPGYATVRNVCSSLSDNIV